MSDPKTALSNAPVGSQVRVYRSGLEDGFADGYLVAAGPDFFAIHLVDKGIRLDGFNCMRYADVTSLEMPAPYGSFLDRVLELRGQRVADAIPVDVSSVGALIRTAGAAWPVVTLHFESKDPDVCTIGKVLTVTTEEVEIRPIAPGGEWRAESESYELADVSRVDFGGSYEEALVLAAGER